MPMIRPRRPSTPSQPCCRDDVVVGPAHVDVADRPRRCRASRCPTSAAMSCDVQQPHVPGPGRRQLDRGALFSRSRCRGSAISPGRSWSCVSNRDRSSKSVLTFLRSPDGLPTPGAVSPTGSRNASKDVHQPAVGGAREVVAAVVERRAVGEDVRSAEAAAATVSSGACPSASRAPVCRSRCTAASPAVMAGAVSRIEVLAERAERRHGHPARELPRHPSSPAPVCGRRRTAPHTRAFRSASRRRSSVPRHDFIQLRRSGSSPSRRSVPGLQLAGRR